MPVMTIRLTRQESARVARLAKKRKVSRSEVVREAIASLDEGRGESGLDRLSNLVGRWKDGPPDLATHPRHLKGFGRSKE